MWRKDSLSCHGFRTYEKAKLMTKYLDSLSGKKEIDIENLLGYPIDKYKINGSTIFKYTLDHPCNIQMINGKYKYDFCWLEINQNKDRYFSSIVCE